MADGSIIFDTGIQTDGMENGFEKIKNKSGSVARAAEQSVQKINSAFSNVDISKSAASLQVQIAQMEAQLASVGSELKVAIAQNDDAGSKRLAEKQIAIYDKLAIARQRLASEVASAAQKQAAAEEKAAQREADAAQKRADAEEKAARKRFKSLTKSTRHFGSRLREIVSGALVFNVISAGLRGLTQHFGSALKANREFSAGFAQLKGAFFTAFQPVYEFVLPALITLMRVLTAVMQVVGRFFAAVSGKSYGQMAKNAAALNKEANAIGGVGSAAKEAKKQLMGFDEINRLESPDTGGGGAGAGAVEIAPNFEEIEITDGLKRILYLIGAIGAALLTWKIASAFTDSLSLAAGLALAVGGALLFGFNWADAFANGIDWGNLAGMLGGLIVLAGGLALAFGPVGAAIGLLVGGIALVVLAMYEWITTGELSGAACAALVTGIMAIGGAFALFTGSWIPLVIAAVVGFVIACVTKGEEIKEAFGKVMDWLRGFFYTDWRNLFGQDLGSALNVFSWFIGDTLGGIEQMLVGLIDFIQGVFTGNWAQAWDGVASIVKGAVNIVISVINGMINLVVAGLNGLFSLLSFKIPLPGGGSIGWDAPQITSSPQIPYLAKGAVIPPNREFMAVLGDQRHGNNIEAPEDLIRKIVREEAAGGAGDAEIIALLRELIEVVLGIHVGDEVIGRAAERYNRSISRAKGW